MANPNSNSIPSVKYSSDDKITVDDLRTLVRWLDQFEVPGETPVVVQTKGLKGRVKSIGVEGWT